MSITPLISLVAYEDARTGKVFVKVPNERGRWVLTDRCVIQVECPHCKAARGEPCKAHSCSPDGYQVNTHHLRRSAGSDLERRAKRTLYLTEEHFA